jgi:hypothetical protein
LRGHQFPGEFQVAKRSCVVWMDAQRFSKLCHRRFVFAFLEKDHAQIVTRPEVIGLQFERFLKVKESFSLLRKATPMRFSG